MNRPSLTGGSTLRTLATCLLALLVAGPGRSANIHVPGDQPTIQAGVDAALAGDSVLLASGTYTGAGNRDIEVPSVGGITIRSESGDPTTCIIDCEDLGRGFLILPGATEETILEAVTIRNGSASDGGGAIVYGTPRLHRCVFSSCQATGAYPTGMGGGLWTIGDAEVSDCTFTGNSAAWGGGIFVDNNPQFTDCRIIGNSVTSSGGGVAVYDYASPTFTHCLFANNIAGDTGGGLAAFYSCVDLDHCTITGNSAESSLNAAGGIYAEYDDFVIVEHSLIAFNLGAAIVDMGVYNPISLVCVDLFGNSGGDWTGEIAWQAKLFGNFSSDPLFCDPGSGDFTIRSDSPCAPPGVTGCGLVGALPVGCGPVATEKVSWGKIKSHYR